MLISQQRSLTLARDMCLHYQPGWLPTQAEQCFFCLLGQAYCSRWLGSKTDHSGPFLSP